nr:hypothetical protein [Tanacetum cinerariifolium]
MTLKITLHFMFGEEMEKMIMEIKRLLSMKSLIGNLVWHLAHIIEANFGRYPHWRSRFLRYIDTRPNGDALRNCILNGSYIPTTIVVQAVAVAATDDSPAIPEHTTVETPMNMSPANKAHFELEKEAIHLILTGIGDEI